MDNQKFDIQTQQDTKIIDEKKSSITWSEDKIVSTLLIIFFSYLAISQIITYII